MDRTRHGESAERERRAPPARPAKGHAATPCARAGRGESNHVDSGLRAGRAVWVYVRHVTHSVLRPYVYLAPQQQRSRRSALELCCPGV